MSLPPDGVNAQDCWPGGTASALTVSIDVNPHEVYYDFDQGHSIVEILLYLISMKVILWMGKDSCSTYIETRNNDENHCVVISNLS